ncbi:hypothetical protein KSP35_05420 [Aquihabitans sp. G128]|uniref:hypothetical protein n=1 Tax=Aquihabitans sp. G128 TaxID=2849779 RepID=UPI001C227F4D|nr:hypothetical protein [Aquihabitans sp. G128]QXC62248.1 hypothetical protein KSP35_05420 [Aquihabitans sp. G128]
MTIALRSPSHRTLSLAFSAPYVVLPIISTIGARLAPSRRRGVVTATVLPWLALVLVSKLGAMTVSVLAAQGCLVLLCVSGATLAQSIAQRPSPGRPASS